jgi:mannitol/fructose-specific phosphotransferase system IIA component (Ntr-type)
MLVTDLLTPSQIIMSMEAADKPSALLELASLITPQGNLTPQELVTKLLEREAYRSTGYGKGVALPRTCHANAHAIVLGRCRPIEWGSNDHKPVELIVLLTGPTKRWTVHFKLLIRVAKVLADDAKRQAILDATTPETICAIFTEPIVSS